MCSLGWKVPGVPRRLTRGKKHTKLQEGRLSTFLIATYSLLDFVVAFEQCYIIWINKRASCDISINKQRVGATSSLIVHVLIYRPVGFSQSSFPDSGTARGLHAAVVVDKMSIHSWGRPPVLS